MTIYQLIFKQITWVNIDLFFLPKSAGVFKLSKYCHNLYIEGVNT